jgi:hypothetical protein
MPMVAPLEYIISFSIFEMIYAFIFLRSVMLGHIPNSQWIYDSPANSNVESKLTNYLLELGSSSWYLDSIYVITWEDLL